MRQQLHPRNPHGGRYDFDALCRSCPELRRYLQPNPAGDQTIDFSKSKAVTCLNQALLAHYYKVRHWQIPEGYLCPAIPGRANYIHYLADLLATGSNGEVPVGKDVKVLDVGTGASCIYPIIGSQTYGWTFVGTDIHPRSIQTARANVEANHCLTKLVKVVLQEERNSIFKGIIQKNDRYALSMCNPPFHASVEEARISSQRKVSNLGKGGAGKASAKLNFGGLKSELWSPGGEVRFITRMMKESVDFAERVGWFTSLVSTSEHLRQLKRVLAKLDTKQIQVINMSQGQKQSRFIAWSFQA